MGQIVTRMGALHPHKYPKGVFPIDEQQELRAISRVKCHLIQWSNGT